MVEYTYDEAHAVLEQNLANAEENLVNQQQNNK